jgi:hypothetical protein
MTTFSIAGTSLPRLARLAQATDDNPGLLRHISLRTSTSTCRFAATSGRILAAIVIDINDFNGEPIDAILDHDQYVAALKLVGKNARRITITIEKSEVRMTAGTVSAVIRRHEGLYPNFDHVFSKTLGQRWVPCVSSLDPHLTSIAQSIAGKTPLLFCSPAQPESNLHRLWGATRSADVAGFPDQDAVPQTASIQGLVRAPAYWSDHELFLLIMPVTRGDADHQLDLARFVCPLSAPATASAAA